MPKVGDKDFSYDAEGIKEATEESMKTGLPISDGSLRSVQEYAGGGKTGYNKIGMYEDGGKVKFPGDKESPLDMTREEYVKKEADKASNLSKDEKKAEVKKLKAEKKKVKKEGREAIKEGTLTRKQFREKKRTARKKVKEVKKGLRKDSKYLAKEKANKEYDEALQKWKEKYLERVTGKKSS